MLASEPIFKKVYEALERHDSQVRIVTTKDFASLSAICAAAAENATSSIYVNGFEFQRTIGVTTCFPKYSYGVLQSQQYIADCKKKRSEIIGRCKAPTPYDTLLSIHNELAKMVQYKDDGKLSHSIVGPLLFGRGVCDGFSKTLKFILDELSIPCFVVNGTATDPHTGKNESHAWNVVKIDNSWVHIDLTFDTTISQPPVIRHDYFGLNTPMIARDHQFDVTLYPVSSSTSLEYYFKHKMILSDKRKLPLLLEDSLRKDVNPVIFRLENFGSSVDFSNELLQQVSDFLSKQSVNAAIELSYNIAQSVYCITINKNNWQQKLKVGRKYPFNR